MITDKEKCDYIIGVLRGSVGNAVDNLVRAEVKFKGQDLNETYGFSGQTRQSIIDAYQREYDRANASLEFFLDLSAKHGG